MNFRFFNELLGRGSGQCQHPPEVVNFACREFLMKQPGVDLDLIRRQFEKHGLEERFHEFDPRS